MNLLLLPALLATQAALPSTPDLGKAAGRCRMPENGPSFLVTVEGLKDRRGLLKLEVYPDNDDDFLADDNKLIAAGKTFRRVEVPTPAAGAVHLCIRVPGPGRYAVSLLHDRDGNRKFGLSTDGIGFAGNPRLGWSKPHAAAASAAAGSGPTPITIVMNYRHGLFSFGPNRERTR
jgi:uncharacterized protein (DUF2141 family)